MKKDMDASDKPCRIFAIAGGKGGTGKSFITSSLGAYLALKGKGVVLIDADLGDPTSIPFSGSPGPGTPSLIFLKKSSL